MGKKCDRGLRATLCYFGEETGKKGQRFNFLPTFRPTLLRAPLPSSSVPDLNSEGETRLDHSSSLPLEIDILFFFPQPGKKLFLLLCPVVRRVREGEASSFEASPRRRGGLRPRG